MSKKKSGEEGADKSEYIYQPDKIKDTLNIRDLKWTDKQKALIDIGLDKNCKIIFINGPAGSSKTLLAVYCALKLLNDKRVGEAYYLRSAVESSDSKIGYLPGSADEKFSFYNIPLLDKLYELLPQSQADKLIKEQKIKAFPINFMRGLSLNSSCLILDESQNSSIREIITVISRLGKFSRCFVLADPTQTDLNNGKRGGFEQLFNIFSDKESQEAGIQTFTFDESDILRSDITRFIVKKLKTAQIKNLSH